MQKVTASLAFLLVPVGTCVNINMTITHSDIAVVLYDTTKPHCQDIHQNLYDFTRFKLGGQHSYNIIETRDITRTIQKLTESNFSWVVVVAVGNFLDQSAILDTVQHAVNQQVPLIAHIVDRGGYYHFHSQWFAMNLAEYKAVGMPSFRETYGTPVELVTVETSRSEQNVHHDYTPIWIAPVATAPVTYISDNEYFGIHVVSKFVQAGHRVVNIPDLVRNKKNFCYPDHNHDEIVKLIADPEYTPQDEGLWWFAKALKDVMGNLMQGYYVLNTEHLMPTQQLGQFDCFIGVCGGLKPACVAGQDNFVKNSKIYLFDISRAAVEWQQYLLANWDGDFAKFETLFRNFQSQHPTYRPVYFSHASIDDNIDWFLNSAGLTRPTFQAQWQRYQHMDHEFVELDLLQDATVESIKRMAGTAQHGSYLWVSNAFRMDYLMFYKTQDWAHDQRNNFVNKLRNQVSTPLILEDCGQQIALTDV